MRPARRLPAARARLPHPAAARRACLACLAWALLPAAPAPAATPAHAAPILRRAQILTQRAGLFDDSGTPADREAAARRAIAWVVAYREAGAPHLGDALLTETVRDSLEACQTPTARTWAAWHKAFPENDRIRNDYAWALLEAGRDPHVALALVRGTRRWATASRDTLAVAQLRCGLPAEALQSMLAAFDGATDEERLLLPNLYDHLGDLLCANGHWQDALRAWGAALARAKALACAGADEAAFGLLGFDRAATRRKRTALKVLLRKREAAASPAQDAPKGKTPPRKENA